MRTSSPAAKTRVALGFPEEVVKAWLRSGKKPTAWLIPDVRCASGIVQWALEFPLYFALFMQGLFAQGTRIRVLVHRRDWPDVVEYLRLSLLGLTREEMRRAAVKPDLAEMLARKYAPIALGKPITRAAIVAAVSATLPPAPAESSSSQ